MNGDHIDGTSSLTEDPVQENERLVRAIAEGDEEAERTFAIRYLRPVRAMLLARSRNPDLSSDLQQDVMIEAICALRRGQLREPAKLTAFVVAITRNVLNNHFRSSGRRPEPLELPENLPDLSSTADKVEDEERETQAMGAIESLDPIDRRILQMTLVDGLKPGIIAQKLQINPDVVRQRKLRATRRVIEFVRKQSQNDSPAHSLSGQKT